MDLPQLVVEVGFDGNAAPGGTSLIFDDATRGKFNTGTFGDVATFTDITEYMKSGSLRRGASRSDGVYARAEAGTAQVELDNADARFDPTYTLWNEAPGDGSFETDTTGWATEGSGGTSTVFARQNGWSQDGSWALRSTATGVPNNGYRAAGMPTAGPTARPCVPGEKFVGLATIKMQTGLGGGGASRNLVIEFFSIIGGYITGLGQVSSVTTGTTPVTLATTVATAPANAAIVRILPHVYNLSGGSATVDWWVDAVVLARGVETPLTGYFAGSVAPYASQGTTKLKPMRPWRIRANGIDLWRGYVDDWRPVYPGNGFLSDVMLLGTDAVKVLANDNRPAVDPPVGAGEDSGARVNRILDRVGWPATERVVATGKTRMQETALAQPAWTELALTADTEVGELYIDGRGRPVFRNRHAVLTETRSTVSQATFGLGGLNYADVAVSYGDERLANLVSISRAGGVEQTAFDQASIDEYLERTYGRNDLLHETDGESLAYAQYVLMLLKDPRVRFDTIRINPLVDPDNLYPEVLGREYGDRITVRLQPPGRADVIQRDCFIRGIQHDWTRTSWMTTWALQDVGIFDEPGSLYENSFVFDNATTGKFDTGGVLGF